jgi:hypothetical protein
MEFYKYQPLWGLLKQVGNRSFFGNKEQFFAHYAETAELSNNPFAYRRGLLEDLWERIERPYYNLYPAIVPMLLGLRLDIPCSSLKDISIQPIEVRLPVDLDSSLKNTSTHSIEGNSTGLVWPEGRIKSLLMGIQPVPESVDSEMLVPGLVIAFDIGEVDEHNHPILSFKFFPLREDMTIEEAVNLLPPHQSFDVGVPIPQETMTAVVKLCACIALIDSDSDIIAPDILVADKAKWEGASEAARLALLEKAKRRGKNGWNIGSEIQYAPHYRRPHPALVHVGKGRMLTRIVMRKGSVVHRGKLISIPTGFDTEQE